MSISLAILLLTSTCPGCDPVWRETEVRHSRPAVQGEIFDPKERVPEYAEAFSTADRNAERKVGNVKRDEKFIFVFWREKKRILKDDFGIVWKTPAELNPKIQYESYGQPKLTLAEIKRVRLAVSPRMTSDESFFATWREYDGRICLTTKSATESETRIYYVTGPENAWIITGPHIIRSDHFTDAGATVGP